MNWPLQPLGDLTHKIGSGSTPRGGDSAYKEAGIPLIRSMNVHDGMFKPNGLAFIDDEQARLLRNATLQKGDVLINITGASVARSCILPDRYSGGRVNQHVAIVRPKEVLDAGFLNYFLTADATKRKLLNTAGGGATREALTKSQLESLEIPLPPLEEQKRIAAILDKADQLRRKRRQAIALLDSLTQSIFLEMFGSMESGSENWPTEQLGHLVDEFRYGTSEKAQPDGFPTLRIPNVVGGSISLTDLKSVPVNDKEFNRLRLRTGDLLFVRTNGNKDYVGRSAVVTNDMERVSGHPVSEFIYASYLIRARMKFSKLNPHYLQSFLSGPSGRKMLLERAKTSAGQYNINTEGLGSLDILLPPLAQQGEFERRATEISARAKALQRQSLSLDTLFASLQHRAFAGQL